MKYLALPLLAALFLGLPRPADSLPAQALPYVERIQIGPHDPTPIRPICPTDSIRVTISGSFPGLCCATKRIVLLPNPAMNPLPEPPIVRVIVDHDTGLGCPCSSVPEPWTGIALLPPLPSRDYWLPVEVLERGGGPDSTLTATGVPFRVSSGDSCGVSEACLWAGWEHHGSYGSCDANVNEREAVTFMVKPQVALAGLQGRLRSWEQGLRILAIEPIGVAAGMRLSWTPELQGARFVLFAEQGAPIPAGELQPILSVRADVQPPVDIEGVPPPGPVFHLGAGELLGADASGKGVLECLPPPYVRLAPEVAVLCIEQPCDFNQDGLNDVRDIVRMVRCVIDGGPCPPDADTRLDCDASGRFNFADVLCCASHMLRQPGCPTCPIDTIRVETSVTVTLGVPRPSRTGVDVPLLVSGLDRIGAARLRFRFPSDRFTARFTGAPGIFYLQAVENDMLTMGIIGGMPVPVPASGAGPAFDDPGPLVVRLTLRPGQNYGGELQLVDGQLSGLDGVLLDVDLDLPGVPLEAEAVALSAPWPNPSAGRVRFTVSLDAPAQLDVAVHDIAGRRLATVFRGNRGPGRQDFSWNGRRDDGSEVSNGLYFLRVVANNQVWKRKLVLVRGPQAAPTGQNLPVP